MNHRKKNNQTSTQILQSLHQILRYVDFERSLKGKTPSITITQMRVLSFFYEHDVIHASFVSKALSMSMPSVNNIITRLESAGYVLKKKNPQNKRFSDIYLTKKGKARVASFGENHARVFGSILSRLEMDDLEALNAALRSAAEIIGRATSTPSKGDKKC